MKSRKPKMGRPPKAPGEAREVVFTMRLTEAERAELAEAAGAAGVPPTQWARETLLRIARSGDTPPAQAMTP